MSITIVFPVPVKEGMVEAIYTCVYTHTHLCKVLTHISVDIVSFWGFWFCKKLKDMQKYRILHYK